MNTMHTLLRWLLTVFCCLAVVGLPHAARAAGRSSTAPSQVKVMFMVQGPGQERSHVVENTLAQAFLKHGYKVIDAAAVTQSLRRSTYLLKQSEVEAAKRLGSGLGADIVVSGGAKSGVVDKSYTLLEGKKVIVSQAGVSVRAVLARNGNLIVTESASATKPFDTTGEKALQMAAEKAATRLLQGIEEFMRRDTIDYRLGILNVPNRESMALQENLRKQLVGVRQVDKQGSDPNILELGVSVAKDQDLAFKQGLFLQLSKLGLGTYDVVARDGEAIYFRKMGESRPPNVKQTPYKQGYGKSWAVLIGINEYLRWPKLQYAVKDARAVEELVRGLGFDEVMTVLDSEATQRRILHVLGDELYAKTQDNDRVFIFFAGHGQTQDLPNGEKTGYIIPVDGELDNYYSTAISMQRLQELADRTRAKHMFYAMDACFSGLLLRFRGETLDGSPLQKTTEPVRQVLTAGGEEEKVVESGGHGLFTKSFLRGLSGAADLNSDGYITASELSQYVTSEVLGESRNSQNPVFGRLGSGQGEFVFVRK
jgi:Caspase domain